MDIASAVAWLRGNWYVTLVVILWIVANVTPRPHPESMTGWQKTVWTIVDRLCVLTADALPGKLKWLFAPSPPVTPLAPVPVPAEVKKDEDKS